MKIAEFARVCGDWKEEGVPDALAADDVPGQRGVPYVRVLSSVEQARRVCDVQSRYEGEKVV